MEIIDFLPKYPSINQHINYSIFQPYDEKENFNNILYHKKEFYENKLEENEEFPSERGTLTKYQNTIVRFLSSNTLYDRLLLVHDPGLGKTCSAIGSVEKIRQEHSSFKGALILAKGDSILDNFRDQLVNKCTYGQYIPENFEKLSAREKVFRIKKLTSYYSFNTFQIFAKELKNMSNEQLNKTYSDHIIIIDEVHNLRIQDKNDMEDEIEVKKEEQLEVYKQFKRLVHKVNNCKILLMSGTPLKDSIDELASIGNLLLPEDQQFPEGDDFLREYTQLTNDIYTIKKGKIQEIKDKLKGKISVLKERPSKISKQFLGEKIDNFVIYNSHMSEHQLTGYNKAFEKDKQGGLFENSRQASLFVFPDGTYGRDGFKKYVEVVEEKKMLNKRSKTPVQKKYKFNNKFDIKNSDKNKLDKLKKYSSKYAEVVEKILKIQGNCFFYSSIVEGGGCIILSLILELFGYSRATGLERESGKRYALLTGSTTNNRSIVERFNKPDNVHGDFIQLIIGSRAVSEGLSFNNIIFESILTPHWNYSETSQAIARGIRLGSHNELLKLNIQPKVEIQQIASVSNNFSKDMYSIDLHMYKISQNKDVSIKTVLRIFMEIAFDCPLNYVRNRVYKKDDERECEYQKCDYICDGFNDMKTLELKESDIDYSSYNVLYSNQEYSDLKKKTEELFRKNIILTKNQLLSQLEKYKNQELYNIIYILNQKNKEKNLPENTFHYNRFLEAFSNFPIKKITNKIENIFRKNYILSLADVKSHFPEYNDFEVLTSLSKIINENISIQNKDGFINYLREENNKYFLVSDINIESSIYNEYYSKNLSITSQDTAEDIIKKNIIDNIPNIIKEIFYDKNQDKLKKLCLCLPLEVQEIIVENVINAEERNIIKNQNIRKNILQLYSPFILKSDNLWLSTVLKNKYRCKTDIWSDCTEQQIEDIKETKEVENPYKISGTKNPTDKNIFCIVEHLENKSIAKTTGKESGSKMKTGQKCPTILVPKLLDIAINKLKIFPSKDEKKYESINDIDDIKEAIGKLKLSDSNKNRIKVFMEREDDDIDYYIRVYSWFNKKFSAESICKRIREFLEEKGLVISDENCGSQTKRKVKKS